MEKKQSLREEVDREADRFTTALARIQLLDDEPVYRAAVTLDNRLVELRNVALSQQWQDDAWRARRSELSAAVRAFQTAARQQLGAKQIRLDVR
jgi:hypothetical protein